MKIKHTLAVTFLMLGFTALKSQDTVSSKSTFDLNGVLNNVNNEYQTTVNFSAMQSVKWKKFETSFSTDYQLINQGEGSSVNDVTARFQPRIVDKNYSIFGFSQLSSLESKKINQRFESGLGGGITLFRTKYLESTASYAALYYSNAFSDGSSIAGLRHSPRTQLFGKMEKYKISYYYEIYFQPRTDNIDDYILRSKAKLGFDLTDKLKLSVNYSTWFESNFQTGAFNNIKTLTFGAAFSN